MSHAPFFADIAHAPDGAAVHWVTAEDDVRIRVGLWGGGERGTVLLFPGRTEYIEKYGVICGELVKLGFSVAIVDWRGQGLADRALEARLIGHVERFTDFQHDVRAMISLVEDEGLPAPLYLMAHSMGGCIGLRTLHERPEVKSAIFTGPMWGIEATPFKRMMGWTVSTMSRSARFDTMLTPGTALETYVLTAPYEDNMLTTDEAMFELMQTQLKTHPELALGGPSLAWLNEALRECRALAQRDSPDQPAEIFVGSAERIVDVARIHDRAERWSNAKLHVVETAEHEVLMEGPEIRAQVMDAADRLFR